MNLSKIKYLLFLLLLINYINVFAQSTESVEHGGREINIPDNFKIIEKKPVKEISHEDFDVNILSWKSIHFDKYSKKLYALDFITHVIAVFDENLNYLGELGGYGQAPGKHMMPIGINANSIGELLITDRELMRARIYDNNFIMQNQIKIPILTKYPVQYDKYNNIIIYDVRDTTLFIVYNKYGEKIDCFGELLGFRDPTKDGNFWNYNYNKNIYTVDEDGFVYCAFLDHPIIRKYSPNGKLLSEVNYFNFTEVQERFSEWLKEWKIEKGGSKGTLYSVKGFARCLSVNDKYIYIFISNKNSIVYVLDKDNLTIVKGYLFNASGNKNAVYIEPITDKIIYGIIFPYNLVKYNN